MAMMLSGKHGTERRLMRRASETDHRQQTKGSLEAFEARGEQSQQANRIEIPKESFLRGSESAERQIRSETSAIDDAAFVSNV
jgi:hypothetical protein